MSASNLQLRLLTAAVGLPVVAGVAWFGAWPFAIVAGLAIGLAGIEFGHGWLFPSMTIRDVARQVWGFGLAGVFVVTSHGAEQAAAGAATLGGLFLAAGYAPTRLVGVRKPYRVQGAALLYLGVLGCTLVLVRDVEDGRAWFFLGLLSTFAVDTGAYAVGRLFGRHKLAPKISPKKTVEGAIGGYIAGVAAVIGLNALFDTGVSTEGVLYFALPMPIVAQAGDLFESWMKRRMGIKDASGLLPGHGGFLDRLDSILFVMPLLYLFLQVRVL